MISTVPRPSDSPPLSFPDIAQQLPSAVYILNGSDTATRFERACPVTGQSGKPVWETGGTSVAIEYHGPSADIQGPATASVFISSSVPVKRITLRWNHTLRSGTRLLGDAWERSYGELEWRGYTAHRLMPWYFLMTNAAGTSTAGFGVCTGAASIACWHADAGGITLHLDVRAGGVGLRLGDRILHAARLLQLAPREGLSTFSAASALCAHLASAPSLLPRQPDFPANAAPSQPDPRHAGTDLSRHRRAKGLPVVGHNDWYWLYGRNSEALILEATRRFMDLYPSADKAVRPWSVIDDGWQTPDGRRNPAAGPWVHSTPRFPDMPGLAAKISAMGARPGIWMRPLLTYDTAIPSSWRLRCPKTDPIERDMTLDPTVPEVLEQVRTDITRLREWGYQLIKHDFSTFDLTGRWGMEMTSAHSPLTPEGWAFSDSTRTTAEVITSLYHTIRDAAGPDVHLIGCNVIGHLAQGLVEIQRIGDDTSASDWDRTRRMGVNTLAFRSVQQDSFFGADADCVPVSPHVPWRLTEQWLDLVARSGTPLFLSMDPEALHSRDQREAVRRALANAVRDSDPAEPLDWLDTALPSRWKLRGEEARFDWNEWL